jgi:hypothetical protein
MQSLLVLNSPTGAFAEVPQSLDGIMVWEKMESRPMSLGTSNSTQRQYVITGTNDPSLALKAMFSASSICPDFIYAEDVTGKQLVFMRGNGRVDPIANADPPTMWAGSVEYGLLEDTNQPYNDGDTSDSFSIGAQEVNVKMAIQQIASYAASGDAPDFGGIIGLTADQQIQGVNLRVPTFRFSRTVYKPNSEVTTGYIAALYACAKSPVNDAPFLNFDGGEVLFLGVNGTRRNKSAGWELTFEFAAEPNSTNAAPASGISGIVKKGWEYLWFYYVPVEKTVGSLKYLVQKAAFATVDKVYNTSNFAALEIG